MIRQAQTRSQRRPVCGSIAKNEYKVPLECSRLVRELFFINGHLNVVSGFYVCLDPHSDAYCHKPIVAHFSFELMAVTLINLTVMSGSQLSPTPSLATPCR